ncbi:hypothetical protein [Streptomyces sp. NPDC048445]|uniref:hypothetical protein n=1 Tax=Streptomyces sp. NPDC048445 TaxID=3365553 RepID=UPI00372087B1
MPDTTPTTDRQAAVRAIYALKSPPPPGSQHYQAGWDTGLEAAIEAVQGVFEAEHPARLVLGATDQQPEDDEQHADREEAERAHAEGEHAFCGVTCEVELPTEHLRNFVIAKGYPGTKGALDELLRRAADQQPETAAADAGLRDRIRRAICEAEGFGWDTDMLEPDEYGEVADAVLAVLPAPTDRAAAPLSEVWTVWCEDEPVYAHFATEDAAKQGTIDCWQENEPSCPDYSWRQDGPRLELLVGGEHGGVYASRHRVNGTPETAPADRRARYAAAIREADGWVLDDGQHMADAVMAVADAEQQELRDAVSGYRRTLAEADQRKQEYKQACIRLRAEVEQLRTDRAAARRRLTPNEHDRAAELRKAAASVESSDVTYNTEAVTAALANGGPFALIALVQLAIGAHLRRLADEAQQPDTIGLCGACGAPRETHHHGYVRTPHADDEAQQPETEAWPTQTEWIGEVLEDDAWMYLGASPDRSVAEKRRASITRRHPDAQTRTVRKTTTYTVATDQPDTETEAATVVAYRDPRNSRVLLCREHGEQWQGVVPVTSEDLPDGGICTFGRLSSLTCGRDVLATSDTETEARRPTTGDRCPGFCIPCMTDEPHHPAP